MLDDNDDRHELEDKPPKKVGGKKNNSNEL
jgi:hypothetical protein